jgi:hypothetical protein
MKKLMVVLLALVLVLSTAVLAGCGGDDAEEGTTTGSPSEAEDDAATAQEDAPDPVETDEGDAATADTDPPEIDQELVGTWQNDESTVYVTFVFEDTGEGSAVYTDGTEVSIEWRAADGRLEVEEATAHGGMAIIAGDYVIDSDTEFRWIGESGTYTRP